VSRRVVVVGAGGHAKVLMEALHLAGMQVVAVTDADTALHGKDFCGAPVIGGDDDLVGKFSNGEVLLVNGMGGVRGEPTRAAIFIRFRSRGYTFATVVHPAAIVARHVELGEGAQLMAGVIVQPGSRIGENAIINTRASVDHDCIVGSHVHIAPGATLSGGVHVGEGSHIGTGASVIHKIRIGSGCVIAAGAAVIRDVPDGTAVAGVPARKMRQ
jgi:sugar O-acyltransferase (sialic acid O-acetyltransferase NeuD family)